jgi:hypothetical protein
VLPDFDPSLLDDPEFKEDSVREVPKARPPFPVEDGIGVFVHQSSETPIYVLTILVQGNLAKPSDFSR